jgi:16S rRNA (guanine527-N7)-methyltransferase
VTEDEARAWMVTRFPADTVAMVSRFVDLVIAANTEQNLISPASVDTIWARHVVDSAQLLAFAPDDAGTWIDIGTGGGFPGMILAICRNPPVIMVEPRRRRAAFLQDAVSSLGLEARAIVRDTKIEAVRDTADVISARAVASIEKLLQAAGRCATPRTRWILPRGRSSEEQDGDLFHVEQSITDPASRIVLIDGTGR